MKKNYTIAVLPGDGIGPEVMAEALKVLQAVADKYEFSYAPSTGFIGGAAIDAFDTPLPPETVQLCRDSDAILLGSIGGPKWDHLPPEKRPELGGLLALRKALNLYANIRPVKVFESLKANSPLAQSRLQGDIDMVTVRELAGGIYFGQPKKLDDSEGLDTMVYRVEEVERIARAAFRLAEKRKKKVTSVDKANVLYTSMLWRKTVERTAKEFPGVQLDHMYVDNAAMQMILNPGQFDVLLTGNLFGDILSDESAAIAGSLGLLPSASLGETVHLYEPAGGSAPDIAGKGIANPIAQILSVALMLDYSFGLTEPAAALYNAVENTLNEGHATADISNGQSVSTSEMGKMICAKI
ncbi:MAG: 3-isopropylmalate dehydrogenase [bacterium]|nr:3-isopropylmalate dehydrogenase [bacterium]